MRIDAQQWTDKSRPNEFLHFIFPINSYLLLSAENRFIEVHTWRTAMSVNIPIRLARTLLCIIISAFLTRDVFGQTPPAAEVTGQSASINGMEMYYEVYGAGEPLVLLHGFFGTGAIWRQFVPEWSKHYKLIIPDLRGHGRSTNPMDTFTHRQAALDVYALLDHLGIGKFKAAGASTGGMTLLHMATQQPERVESMVLLGATIYFPEQAREIMRNTAAEIISDEQIERMTKRHVRGREQILTLRRQFHEFKDNYDDMNFTKPYLSTIKARTLIVHGDRDNFFPVEIPVEMYTSIPHSYLWIIPNGGHVPVEGYVEEYIKRFHEFFSGGWEKK